MTQTFNSNTAMFRRRRLEFGLVFGVLNLLRISDFELRVFVCVLGCSAACAFAAEAEGPPKTDSRSPYIHRISLYDADGTAIKPGSPDAKPYSPEKTCGKCHDMEAISCGWHVNPIPYESHASRAREPYVLSHGKTGTVLPILPISIDPFFWDSQGGLSSWQFTCLFGRLTCGGAFNAPWAYPFVKMPVPLKDPKARWEISGKLELDCLSCHARTNWDINEWAAQIERQNFAWAPMAAAGLGVIRGRADQVPDDFDPLAPPNPDFPERALPKTIYNKALFDPDDRVLFDMPKIPPDERCLACHTTRHVSTDVPPAWSQDRDVHSVAGLSCSDCHRHGLDHRLVRGYEGETSSIVADPVYARNYGFAAIQSESVFTCRGCHLGQGALSMLDRLGGKMRAPRPKHAGLPQVHLDKIACTGCHSGPWPGQVAGRVQTSRAHGLGMSSQTRTPDTPPYIYAPVFARGHDGKIAPHYLLWPSYWGVSRGNSFTPVSMDDLAKATKEVGGDKPDPDKLAAVLAKRLLNVPPARASAISQPAGATQDMYAPPQVVYVSPDGTIACGLGGEVQHSFIGSRQGGLQPALWPMGHDVRPAARSLGAGGCSDCHAKDAAFIFGQVPRTAAKESSGSPLAMVELQGLDRQYQEAFAWSFVFRPYLKIVGFAASGVMAFVLMIYTALGFVGIMRKMFG